MIQHRENNVKMADTSCSELFKVLSFCCLLSMAIRTLFIAAILTMHINTLPTEILPSPHFARESALSSMHTDTYSGLVKGAPSVARRFFLFVFILCWIVIFIAE